MIVADTNLIVYLLLPGDHTGEVQNFYLRESHWVAPILWRSELINVLVTYLRAGRLNVELCEQLLERAEHIMRGRSYHSPPGPPAAPRLATPGSRRAAPSSHS